MIEPEDAEWMNAALGPNDPATPQEGAEWRVVVENGVIGLRNDKRFYASDNIDGDLNMLAWRINALTREVEDYKAALDEIEINTGPRIIAMTDVERGSLLIDINQRAAAALTRTPVEGK